MGRRKMWVSKGPGTKASLIAVCCNGIQLVHTVSSTELVLPVLTSSNQPKPRQLFHQNPLCQLHFHLGIQWNSMLGRANVPSLIAIF